MHGGDHRHVALVHGGERRGAPSVHVDDRRRVGLELLDVDTRAEPASLGPNDHDADVVVDAVELVGEGEPVVRLQRVDRRDIDDDLSDAVLNFLRDGHVGSFLTRCQRNYTMRP